MQSQKQSTISGSPLLLLFVFAIGGCSSGGSIISDYDKTADFGSYNTYNFIENAGPERQGYDSFFSKYMVAAITIEMEKRGYTKSDNPDLLVNFNANLQDKTKVTTTPSTPPMGGYYGYRGGYYGGWGGYGYGTDTHVSQYTEGTFNIDLVDAKKHQLVWESVGVGKVTDKFMENLEETVMNGVPQFFTDYPFVAGSSESVLEE